MTLTQIRPWSQLEDERDGIECSDASECAPVALEAAEDAARPDEPAADRSAERTAQVRNEIRWLYAAFAVGAASQVFLFVWPSASAVADRLIAAAVFGLIVATVAIFLRLQRCSRADLDAFVIAIDRGARSQLPTSSETQVPGEYRPAWRAIERYVAAGDARSRKLAEERRQLALELSMADAQKRHTEAIIDSISDAVLVSDAFDQLVLANPSAETIFGFKRKDAYRKPIASVLDDDALSRTVRQVRESAGRAMKRRAEQQIGERAYAITLSQVSGATSGEAAEDDERTADGKGVVMVMRDITRDREVAQLKSEFVSQVSHELRTPLSSIRAYVEMLVDGEAADENTRREYYNIIQTSADRLGRLIDNMLNISRIESGTVRIHKEPMSVAMIVKEALDMVRPQAEAKRIELTEELTPVVFRISADRDMIYQAVLNLLSNAVKYTPEQGQVHLRMTPHEENQTIRIEVSDTGVGVPQADIPRMFEKFFRVEATKKMAKGTGLGLNLVKHIVETVHDGKVTLTSEVGKGSTFGMILPLMP